MYADHDFYIGAFAGTLIPEADFAAMARAASDVLDGICTIPIDAESCDMDAIAKACCYEAELLYAQGGLDAVNGKAESAQALTEKLDDYSVSRQKASTAQAQSLSFADIPVSPLALTILRRQGLTARWLYASAYRKWVKDNGF